MSDSGLIRFAGDVSIENVSVVTSKGMIQNVTNQTLAIDIYEDLFSPFMTGTITVKDSLDFVNLFPFVGEEYLNLKVYTPSFEEKNYISQQFYIFKVSDRIVLGDRTVVYNLHFISKEAIADVNKSVSKGYKGLISDIAKQIITDKEYGLESPKTVNAEVTANTTRFVSNFWSPIKNLNFITENAVSPSGAANYLFFENRSGFNFVSMDSLYAQDPYVEFVYDNYSRDIQADGRSIFNLNEDYKRITELNVPVVQDYMERIRTGSYASKIISYDTLTKKYYSKNYDMIADFSNNKHLNVNATTTKTGIRNPNALVINYPKYNNVFNDYGDVSNVKTLQKRISQLNQADTTKIEVTVLGRTDYTVGLKVYVKLNKVEPIEKEAVDSDITDKILSGYYIISAINHHINRDKHECTMELIKDSFMMNLDEAK